MVTSTKSSKLRGIDRGSQVHSLIRQFSPKAVPQSDPDAQTKTNNMKMYKDCCVLVSIYLWTNPFFARQASQSNASGAEASRVDYIKEDLLRESPALDQEMRKILEFARDNYPKPLTLKLEELEQ